ncbi:MAG TPA: hypothetical protein VI643_08225 [Planctomycetota bacterium]|nr:hypothetical protein [Planctomycetota bacterium]
MNPSPIPKVLSILRRRRVEALLMGGQACIVYGAAEFSRDIDVAVSVDPANLARLQSALADLGAVQVYFPDLTREALRKGHACHFRCNAKGLNGVRLDVMSVMRGAEPFETLWKRRTEFDMPGVGRVELMSIEDLVRIKKTQRDKDWPMIKRLVEADIVRGGERTAPRRVKFWLRECRTAERLQELSARYPRLAKPESTRRAALRLAMGGKLRAAEDGVGRWSSIGAIGRRCARSWSGGASAARGTTAEERQIRLTGSRAAGFIRQSRTRSPARRCPGRIWSCRRRCRPAPRS